MQVAIVRYNAGNIQSVTHALERLGAESIVTDDPETLRSAPRVIFPGVGEASSAMRYLRERGLDAVLDSLTQPVLGICLGQQLLCSHSAENDTVCLGRFPERVLRFPPTKKVPHMGWNALRDVRGPLFDGLAEKSYVYFVHGYYVETGQYTTATTDYIVPFSAGLSRDNFHALQFHPEKSGEVGSRILDNFFESRMNTYSSGRRRVAFIWGVFGLVFIFAKAIYRMAPTAAMAFDQSLGTAQWAGFATSFLLLLVGKGYFAFHRGFAPRYATRVLQLMERPTALRLALAPFYCMSFFSAPRAQIIRAVLVACAVVGFILGSRSLDQPWRGFLVAGAMGGLAIGMLSTVFHSFRAVRKTGHVPTNL